MIKQRLFPAVMGYACIHIMYSYDSLQSSWSIGANFETSRRLQDRIGRSFKTLSKGQIKINIL